MKVFNRLLIVLENSLNVVYKIFMLKVAGVTVLYHPDKEIISNIFSYLNQIEHLYIVDNSDVINPIVNKLKEHSNITFIENSENIGIASALNLSAKKAIEEGYDLLLTMDQDSTISNNLVSNMVKEFAKDEKIGIIAPFVVHMENPKEPDNQRLEKVMVAMTSGCLISLRAYKEIGGFLDEFFIDYVDNEFCLRMNVYGYNVYQLNSVKVFHRLGAIESKNFIFRKVFPTNHSPLRWYYRTRNRLYFYKNYKKYYPDYIRFDKVVFFKDFIKILLYEKDKIKKINMIILGYYDYKRNKFGKFKLNK